MFPEDRIESRISDIHKRLDSLVESYEEVIRVSIMDNMDILNYWARQLLLSLKGYRMDFNGDKKLLETLFLSYEEQLFKLCLKEDGKGFVKATYLPKSVLI